MAERTPLFVLGAPRSGTSLIYKLLCLHPGAAWINNWHRRRPGLPALAALDRLARVAPGVRHRAWFGEDSNAYRYGRARSPWERIHPAPVEGEPVLRACGLDDPGEPGDAPPPDVDPTEALRRLHDSVVRWAGAPVFVNKRIANNHRLPALRAAFPGARFLVVDRDPRAVAASLVRVDWWPTAWIPWFGGTPVDWAALGRDTWELPARHWRFETDAIGAGLDGVEAAAIRRVSYADLLADPTARLAEIAAFAGLDTDDAGWHRALERVELPPTDRSAGRLDDDAATVVRRFAHRPFEPEPA